MAEKKKYNSILISGRKDQTMTYSKYVKDEESGESVKESLDKKVNVTDELTTQQIKDGAITNEKIKDKNVTNEKLADNSVSNEKIKDKSITNSKFNDDSVDGRVVREASIENRHIGNNAVSTSKIASRSVTTEKIAHNSVSRAELTPDVRSSIDKKADAEQVNNSLYDLEKKIGDRFVVEGDVTNLPDEEDLTSVKESERDVLKLADRSYAPEKFSGKGYKILRRNIKPVSIAVTKIRVETAPSSDGTLFFTINGKEAQVSVSASTDNTTTLVAKKVASGLQESMTEYEVSTDASLITLTRKSSGSVTSSVFSASTTGVVCAITDSTKREFRNILTSLMMNQPNTIYEIRYDFDLDGATIEMKEGCTLRFEGGCLYNGTVKGNSTSILATTTKIFDLSINFEGSFNVPYFYMEWLGAKGDGIQDDSPMFNKCHSIFNIRLLEKTYLLNNTVYIDVQKQYIIGVSSRSILKSTCESPALFFHGKMTNSWNERNNRVNTHGNFTIISNKGQNAIVIGDQIGGEYEGHVDQQTFENIFVIGANSPIYLNSHLYCITFNNISQRYCYYTLYCDDKITDSGETIVFNRCCFWDGGICDVKTTMTFFDCSFHNPIQCSKNSFVCLNNCHFEIIIPEEDLIRDFLVQAKGETKVSISNTDATISDTGTLAQFKYLFEADERSEIIVDKGTWKYFLCRVQLINDSFCKGNVKLININIPFSFIDYHELRKKKIYEQTRDIALASNFGNLIGEDTSFAYNLDFEISKEGTFPILIKKEDNTVEVKVDNFYGNIRLSKRLVIPRNAGSVVALFELELLSKLNVLSNKTRNNLVSFYDNNGDYIGCGDKDLQFPYSEDVKNIIVSGVYPIPVSAYYVEICIYGYANIKLADFLIKKFRVEFI